MTSFINTAIIFEKETIGFLTSANLSLPVRHHICKHLSPAGSLVTYTITMTLCWSEQSIWISLYLNLDLKYTQTKTNNDHPRCLY